MIHRHLPSTATTIQPIGRLPATNRLDLVIGLPLRNQGALTNLLQQLYDPGSPQFHRYLTPEQFAEQFGPTEQDYQTVAAFAKAAGLTVTGTHPNHTLVDVSGSVTDIERAFHVTIRTYPHPKENRTFFAPDVDPSLDLAVPVLSVKGLDNYLLPRPMSHHAPTSPAQGQPYYTGSGTNGTFIGYDYRHAYAPGVALTGTGQSVALFELDGYFYSDITNYEAQAGIPDVTVTNVLIDGYSGAAGSANGEVALDIEMALSMAPGLSRVMVYEAAFPHFDDILNQIAIDDAAKQISSSWGFSIDAMTEQIFQQYAAQGQSIFEACGDTGAYPGAVNTPADDPLVTCVGGTLLTTSAGGGPWSSETAWQFGSGGISQTYAIPSWQQGVSMAGNQGATYTRNVPDVALIAAGCFVVADNGTNYTDFVGTSFSAPLWAGFMALVNQQAAAKGQPPVGLLNPLIYTIGTGLTYAATFHDITTGNNTNSSSPTRFFAVPGYDLCTGWGTPTGSNLINALVALDVVKAAPALFTITSIAHTNKNIMITWETEGGTTNVVQVSPGSVGGSYSTNFTNLSSPIIAIGSGAVSTNYLDVNGATNSPARYYRVKITLPPPSDTAGDPAYAGGWFYGDNGGTGFGPWVFTATGPINSTFNGFYTGSSTTNGGGTGPGIDVNGESWGIYANNNNYATAYRAFANGPLQVGQTVYLNMDNGYIDAGNAVGFVLRNGDATDGPFNYNVGSRFEFFFLGGGNDYITVDSNGQHDTGKFFTDTGLRLVFTLTATDTYSLLVIDNATGSTNSFSGTLGGTVGSTINSLALYNRNSGGSPYNDCFFNSLKITGP